MSLGTRWAF
ncbi:hypothetical protein BDFB_011758 [Asbolus verrucosus]|uniref:Uncharacterized protein n=1 Tax=Asbolus verrucosus TaxID=1661398 RepID=A0A482VK08_ASBVE|nr:hypothetical protein BDFB_011758 [Asbolus verrucosus]